MVYCDILRGMIIFWEMSNTPPRSCSGAREYQLHFIKAVFDLWMTGVLYLLAGFGYIFYALLLVYRFLQMKRILVVLLLCVLVLLVGAGGVYLYYFAPIRESTERIELIVEPGGSIARVAERLEELKVVRSSKAFLLWSRFTGVDRAMQAGKYTFVDGEGAINAAQRLWDAEQLSVAVTITEGLTVEQTAALFSRKLGLDSALFVSICLDTAVCSQYGPEDGNLEGYLYPNTYYIHPDADEEEVVRLMVDQFEKVWREVEISPSVQDLSVHEIVTMASIVEKEATLASERTRISGVFHNRLRKGWSLGADPTVRYALRKFSGPLRVSELKNPSPYNTRIHVGLPPGPICSPGFGSIQAAANPLETKELYFVAKWDGSGAHDFSRTGAEHERKKNIIRRQNELRKRQLQKESR